MRTPPGPIVRSLPAPRRSLHGSGPAGVACVLGGLAVWSLLRAPCVLAEDCDGNGVADETEIAVRPELDCDRDGRLDVCQLAPRLLACATRTRPGDEIEEIESGDLDGDGRADLVVTGRTWDGSAFVELILARDDRWESAFRRLLASPVASLRLVELGAALRVALAFADRAEIALIVPETPGGPAALPMREWRLAIVPLDAPALALAVADLDRDGFVELVVARDGPAAVEVWRGGPVGHQLDTRIAVNSTPRDVALGDLDGDGRIDLVVAREGSAADRTLDVLFSDASGNLVTRAALSFPLAVAARRLLVSDLDLDGVDDVLIEGPDGVDLVFGAADRALVRGTPRGYPDPGDARGARARVGDLDGDGRLDLVVGRGVLHTSEGLLPRGFSLPLPATSGSRPGGIALGDFDGDGDLDLASISVSPRGETVELAWNESGVLRPERHVETIDGASEMLAADLDGDGVLDVAVLSDRLSLVVVHWGPIEGGVEGMLVDLSAPGVDLAQGDLDGDGRAELVARTTAGIEIISRTAPRRFGAPERIVEGGGVDGSVAVIDIDGDGALDLLVSRIDFDPGGAQARVLYNDGTGCFEDVVDVRVVGTRGGEPVLRATAADLDGDGRLDLVTSTPAAIGVARGLAGRAFERSRLHASGVHRGGELLVADLDADGAPEIIALGDEVELFQSDGSGELVRRLALGGPRLFRAGRLVDLDRDGDLDLIAIAADPDDLWVFLSDGGGRLLPLRIDLPDAEHRDLAPGEFDGEAELEWLVLDRRARRIRVVDVAPPEGLDTDGDERLDVCGLSPRFERGDVDQDGEIRLSDAVAVLLFLFDSERRLSCESAADADNDGVLGIGDALAILGWLYLGRAPLAPPFGGCGRDRTIDRLSCEQGARCD